MPGAEPVGPLTQIDWSRPWLHPMRGPGEPAGRLAMKGMTVAEALNAAGAAPVRFVPQSHLPAGMAYERYIFESGCCPTREGLHDFFNGICWMVFPRAKQRLNQLQAAEIGAAGVGAVRGPVRDALTLFDENAALLHAPPPLWEALEARDWQRLFVGLRPLWAEARLLLFGHALLEKLVWPYKSITAHVWRAQPAIKTGAFDELTELDAWLASDLTAPRLAAKPFLPMPVLGVPGWWAANEHPGFYDDARVFRAPRGPRAGRLPE